MPIDAYGHKQAEWRTDRTRAGASACLADIGVHADSLGLFLTGLELEAVSAELTTLVSGRRLEDNAHVLMRFVGGARGMLAASQVAVGHLNNLSLKVYGARAGLEWSGEEPETLRFTPYGERSRIFRRGGPGKHAGRTCWTARAAWRLFKRRSSPAGTMECGRPPASVERI
jgi:predicted dehydrogenase